MQSDIEKLRERILSLAKHSPVADHVRDVALEADRDEWGTDFLRILLHIKDIDDTRDHDLEVLLEEIEKSVGEIDERYPSVRFADAE
jgi:hypothetical protein